MKISGCLLVFSAASLAIAPAADQYWRTDGAAGGIWTSSHWNTDSANATGGTAWAGGDNAVFTADSTLSFASASVGDVTVAANRTVTVAANQTLTLGGLRTFDIGTGATLTWRSQAQSTAAGNEGAGIIKIGGGTLDWGAGPGANVRFNGGFTLNAGTVIVSGQSSFGSGGLNLNGGTLQSSGGNAYVVSALHIGGDVTFSGSGNDVWGMATDLGSATRTITNSTTSGSRAFTGAISGGPGAGLTFTSSGAGRTYINNSSSSFSGPVTIHGGEVGFANDGSLGAGNSIVIDGGRITSADISGNAVTSTWSSSRGIQVGDAAGTSISVAQSGGELTYDGVISDVAGKTGAWTKQGAGTLHLGGVNTYSGTTTVAAGTLVIDGAQGGSGLITVQAGGTFGGGGGTAGGLHLDAGAKFLFSATDTFTVGGAGVTFGGFGIADLLGLDSSADSGIYTLINGPAEFDFTNVANFGVENAYDLGNGTSAYFQTGSFQLVVIPEPAAALIGCLGGLILFRRRRI